MMLALLIYHGSVHLFILRIFQTQHRNKIFQSIEKGTYEEDLILFQFSKDEFEKGLSHIEWVEENEFRIEEEMYDIVKREVKKDSIYIYCLHDKDESILYSVILKIINNLFEEANNNTGKSTTINSLVSEFYFNTTFGLDKFWLDENDHFLTVKVFHLLDGERSIDTPPPRS